MLQSVRVKGQNIMAPMKRENTAVVMTHSSALLLLRWWQSISNYWFCRCCNFLRKQPQNHSLKTRRSPSSLCVYVLDSSREFSSCVKGLHWPGSAQGLKKIWMLMLKVRVCCCFTLCPKCRFSQHHLPKHYISYWNPADTCWCQHWFNELRDLFSESTLRLKCTVCLLSAALCADAAE